MAVVDTSHQMYCSFRKRSESAERKSILKRTRPDNNKSTSDTTTAPTTTTTTTTILDVSQKNGSYQKCVDSAFGGSDEIDDHESPPPIVPPKQRIDDYKDQPKSLIKTADLDGIRSKSLTLPKSLTRTTGLRQSCTPAGGGDRKLGGVKCDDITVNSLQKSAASSTGSTSNVKFKPFTLREKIAWISNHRDRGFVRVFDPASNLQCSVVVPCTKNTTSQQICTKLGIPPNELHVQLNGELIRRLDRFDKPLTLQHNYLESIGFDHVIRRQELGDNLDLGYLIRFYAGRPSFDDGFGRQPLNCYCNVRKGRVFHQWTRRLCILNSSRLLIYPDLDRSGNPDVIVLSRAKVEEIHLRSRGRCIKISVKSAGRPLQTIYLAFDSMVDLNAWLARCIKAAAKIPPISDLSNLHLECLPEQVFCIGSDRLLTHLNLKHNVLKERPPNEDMFSLGWLDDLPRFQSLRSLNLADNDLGHFPAAVLLLPAVTELNLAGNKLVELPSQISKLRNLQTLNVQNNLLTRLPCELSLCDVLSNLDLSFNRFVSIPEVITRLKSLEHWVLNGNRIAQLPTDTALACMGHVKKIELRHCDLRLNLNDGIPVATLPYLTHLDIRDNCSISGIDLRSLHSLQTVNCQRCNLSVLQLNGTALTYVYASKNKLSNLVIMPVPRHLKVFDVSHNNLVKIPEWLTELSKIEKIIASHNQLTTVPHRLFTNVSSLKYLQLNHNQIRALPTQVENCFVEVLLLHHNRLTVLPTEFLASTHKLKILNLSQNTLTSLPSLNPFLDLNKVQQLFLSCNRLTDDVIKVISGYRRLRILDLAYNLIRNIDSSCIEKLQFLEEINISRNKLIALPEALSFLPKLTTLRAHSNRFVTISDFSSFKNLKVLDLAANQLEIVDVRYFLSPHLKHLDVSCNPRLELNTSSFQQLNSDRLVSLIDMSREVHAPHSTSTEVPWQAGFSETSGERNKLCISQLRFPIFDSTEGDAVFGMIDGGLNNEIPLHLQTKLPQLLKMERKHPVTGAALKHPSDDEAEDCDYYMKYTLLMAHKGLQSKGQKLGASCTLCHIVPSGGKKNNQRDEEARYTLHVANSGHTEAVLCRRGAPLVLTKRFIADGSKDEYERIRMAGSIVTEDNEINGITQSSRLLGCTFLYPAVVPEPHTSIVELGEPDEFLLIASRGLWEQMDYAEAVRRIRYIPNPILAAKHLQDVVQSYGYKENLSILVVRFFFNSENMPCGSGDDDGASVFSAGALTMRQRRLGQLGQAASAVNIAEDCGSLTSDDEIHSEPLGRKIKEQPNYYFEYKKKLKEFMPDDSTSSCTPVSTCSLNTLIAEHRGNNNDNNDGNYGNDDDDDIGTRLDDGYQSSEVATPGPMLDLDDVQDLGDPVVGGYIENATIYDHSLSTNTVDGEVRSTAVDIQQDFCNRLTIGRDAHRSFTGRDDHRPFTGRDDHRPFTGRDDHRPFTGRDDHRSSGSSSSSSGLGTAQTGGSPPHQRSLEHGVSGQPIIITENYDDISDSKLRFQLARQRMIEKLHFAPQATTSTTTTIVNVKSSKPPPPPPPPPPSSSDYENGHVTRDRDLGSPIYDTPFKNRIYQTIEDAQRAVGCYDDEDDISDDEEVVLNTIKWSSTPATPTNSFSPLTVRSSDRESRCVSWDYVLDNRTPAPPKTISSYTGGTLGRKSLVVANIDIECYNGGGEHHLKPDKTALVADKVL